MLHLVFVLIEIAFGFTFYIVMHLAIKNSITYYNCLFNYNYLVFFKIYIVLLKYDFNDI